MFLNVPYGDILTKIQIDILMIYQNIDKEKYIATQI